jgi:hypothetical protein
MIEMPVFFRRRCVTFRIVGKKRLAEKLDEDRTSPIGPVTTTLMVEAAVRLV